MRRGSGPLRDQSWRRRWCSGKTLTSPPSRTGVPRRRRLRGWTAARVQHALGCATPRSWVKKSDPRYSMRCADPLKSCGPPLRSPPKRSMTWEFGMPRTSPWPQRSRSLSEDYPSKRREKLCPCGHWWTVTRYLRALSGTLSRVETAKSSALQQRVSSRKWREMRPWTLSTVGTRSMALRVTKGMGPESTWTRWRYEDLVHSIASSTPRSPLGVARSQSLRVLARFMSESK
mmetsp:Transcript_8844/g.25211  ORF Transcript_8844/g.25211 Transcript_8844/m.25211 type:complete len:231 (-) Transcript_8844:385-1077(-)